MSTRELAKWVSSVSYGDLPSSAVIRTKKIIFDCLGACIFTGARTQWGKTINEFAAATGAGARESTIISTKRKVHAGPAALANGTLAEGFELGDFDPHTATRPQPVTVPVALAMAESYKRPGKAVIESVVAGYEVGFRIGAAMAPEFRGLAFQKRGYYSGSLIGAFASAASAGRVIGLDPKHMTWAFGIAGSLTGGFLQGHEEGAWTRRLNAGMTTERGVTAALLAERGFTGPEMPLEGHYGFYKIFSNNEYDIDVLTKDLGKSYKVMDSIIKAFPMNGTLHAPVEALLKIMKAEGLRHSDMQKIASNWYRYQEFLGKKDVLQIVAAQASLPYALAVTSVRGKCTVDEFSDQALHDPEVRAMLDRVEVTDDSSLYEQAGRKSVPGRVTVTTKDGRQFTEEVTYMKGHPQNPMSDDDLLAKFASLTDGVLTQSKRDQIYETTMNLEKLEDISSLLALCVTSKPPRGKSWDS